MDEWKDLKMAVKALAGVVRLSMVYQLARETELTVTDLTARLGISQPLVSWHLHKLRKAGLAEMRKVGRQVYYSLNVEYYQLCLRRLGGLVEPGGVIETFPVGEALIEAEASSEL